MSRFAPQADTERGSVLPIVALSMVAILMIAAIVIDLGYTRSDRNATRAAADAAATSGALTLNDSTDGSGACEDALFYAFKNLGENEPSSAQITSACSAMAGPCDAGTSRSASLTVDHTVVEVDQPVLDGDVLMQATALGRDVPQAIDGDIDGGPCDRLAVSINRPQAHIFGGVAGGQDRRYSVHSVARFGASLGPNSVRPALVALNRTRCSAIDAGSNGTLVLVANPKGPGIAFSDSDGSAGACTGTSAILASRSSARLIADSSGSTIGQLGWFSAPPSKGYNNSASVNSSVPATYPAANGNYVGQLTARSQRVTRVPADRVYHCQNVPLSVAPACAASADPTQTALELAAAPAPSGFTTYTGACDTSSGTVSLSGKVWVKNCPVFTVKGGTLSIAGGSTVIFNAMSVEAGGKLFVNSSGVADTDGLPVATNSGAQTTLIVKSTATESFKVQSTSATVAMAQTTLFNGGGLAVSGSSLVRWSAPTSGLTKGLLYWSEAGRPFNIQGGPTVKARGVVFQGNGTLTGGGGGTIDLTNVQMWVDSAAISGSTTVKLAADPENSIGTASSGAALIR